MTAVVVSDTSPIRALQAVERLDLLGSLFTIVYVPPRVAAELADSRAPLPPVGPDQIANLIIRAPGDTQLVHALTAELDPGEAEALALAIELRADRVLIDEAQGRRVARQRGLPTLGVLALLVIAKRAGLVPSVAPLIDQMDARISFRISDSLRARVLADAGE